MHLYFHLEASQKTTDAVSQLHDIVKRSRNSERRYGQPLYAPIKAYDYVEMSLKFGYVMTL